MGELKEKKDGEEIEQKLREDIQALSKYDFFFSISLHVDSKSLAIETSNTFNRCSTISHLKMHFS